MTQTYIENVLLRAQRAMLIISDRIQDNFLYLYSDIYSDLKYKQRDIYILFRSLTDTFPYRASYDTYEALILVLVSKCQEVDSYNSEYNTINPNYQDIGGSTTIIDNPVYIAPVRLYFTNASTVTSNTWQASYADRFGNDPTLAVYLYNGVQGSYSLFEGVSETLQFDITGLLLQSFTFDFGTPQTGYILIST